MHTLNLGIVAHVDAGKTSLTERLLFDAGVIDSLGSVNLIDTPGHPGFIAEVERVLGVLDGAVLVVSAVEGVQAQTRVLMGALRRLAVPTLLFVNKIDRRGARPEAVLRAVVDKLTPAVTAMATVRDPGTRAAATIPWDRGRRADEPSGQDPDDTVSGIVGQLATHDDALLSAWVTDERSVGLASIRSALADQTRRCLLHPVFPGSAITGAGVRELTAGIAELLPRGGRDVDGPASGTVFAIARGRAGQKLAHARLVTGTLRVRDRVAVGRPQDTEPRTAVRRENTVTGLDVYDGGPARPASTVRAGQIAVVHGLTDARVGDAIGLPPPGHGRDAHQFAAPTLETVVVPLDPAARVALHTALAQLSEQDPLIGYRLDEARHEILLSLYGEVQKEVVQATLADDFGVEVGFRGTTTICVERPVGTGAALDVLGEGDNPFLATVGLRVEPAPAGSGTTFRLGVEPGAMPLSFFTAVRDTVTSTLTQGPHGWQVLDCAVTLTHSGYWARQSHANATFDKSMSSTAGDFRLLTPLVLAAALSAGGGTRVFEPVHRFRLTVPTDSLSAVLSALARVRGVPLTSTVAGTEHVVEGDVPAAAVHELTRQLPGLTHGEGVLETAADHHRPVEGSAPTRARAGADPNDRRRYLMAVTGRGDARETDRNPDGGVGR